ARPPATSPPAPPAAAAAAPPPRARSRTRSCACSVLEDCAKSALVAFAEVLVAEQLVHDVDAVEAVIDAVIRVRAHAVEAAAVDAVLGAEHRLRHARPPQVAARDHAERAIPVDHR